MDKDILKRFFLKHPVDRFLFGSDSLFTDPQKELGDLLGISFLRDGDKEKITFANAAALLGIDKDSSGISITKKGDTD